MLYYLLLPFLSILLIVLQSTIADIIFSGRLVFEISLIAVVYAGFRFDLIRGVILAFVLGFLWDCIGGPVLGLCALIYTGIFFFSFFAADFLTIEKKYVVAFFCFFCAFLKEIILALFYYLVFKVNVLVNTNFIFIVQALMIGLFAPVFFYLMDRAEVFLYGEKE
jgi:rod shape-determining protein MreD